MVGSQQTAPFDYIIFGATGDLTMRKLIPGLYNQLRIGHIPKDARIIGTARSHHTREEFIELAHQALDRFIPEVNKDEAIICEFLKKIDYVVLDGTKSDSNWKELGSKLNKAPDDRVRVFYYSTAPHLFGSISKNLSEHKLITKESRVVLEKPIGTDSASANEINESVSRYFSEHQIYRIDHYLGKETVQDITAIRFANPFMGAVWSHEYIQSIQITAAETVGVEGRASYYDTSGALRDMIQNHLLQILSLCAMEAPNSLEADDVRNAKVAVLKALRPIKGESIRNETMRAQYTKGGIGDQPVPGYLEELGHDSNTETYALMRAYVDTPRWKDVPFYLRTLKRSTVKVSEVVVTFKPSANGVFKHRAGLNKLVIRLQPNEGLELFLNAKDPSSPIFSFQQLPLSGKFATVDGSPIPDSYERLMLDVVRDDPTLFIRRDEVEAAWAWVEPTLQAWAEDKVPMEHYAAGSRGPIAAKTFIAKTGDEWHENMKL
ncbi:glucose-6-phosphate dehydrogenase [Aristophania vespae]|uniref:Glucose-6-phosphate 1-dehydrogenase n=1 Tax=Aristophania vespae TaxID=2697033 RepID=A0A6P1NE09_9PROT|nr:glucose-6-phosphate dehydrogenase [Aristophania vespae]QHI95739.1 glucose-6-phosphate dehydrogenase [Aristophania vespae]UMM63435.1 Glucose-6-phosphate 1-dehydrogenase [Aristophania vespae]